MWRPSSIDGFFRGASFCKYVCPIGQFNFVQSLVSPLEVKVREPDVCTSCRTKDCIRGGDGIPGCELNLYQPRKTATWIARSASTASTPARTTTSGFSSVPPGRELWRDPLRSGIGRFSRRVDLAALVLVLVFGAFANAAGMVGPVVDWEERVRASLGLPSLLPMTSLFYLFALIVLPLVVVSGAAIFSRWWGRREATWLQVATRYTYALVPLGFAMWLSHYCFHFFSSYDTVIPTTQRFAADLGWTIARRAAMELHVAAVRSRSGFRVWRSCFLDLGLLLSLYVGYRIATPQSGPTRQGLRAFLPWAARDAAVIRRRGMDCASAHADARHDSNDEVNRASQVNHGRDVGHLAWRWRPRPASP